jgi:hypothetical protein
MEIRLFKWQNAKRMKLDNWEKYFDIEKLSIKKSLRKDVMVKRAIRKKYIKNPAFLRFDSHYEPF